MKKIFLFASCLLVCLGCASAPRLTPLTNMGEFQAFQKAALIYLHTDVKGARALLDKLSIGGLSNKDSAQVLDRTSAITAALYGQKQFFAIFYGNYPKVLVASALNSSNNWKKQKSVFMKKKTYFWREEKQGLSLAIDSKNAVLSDGNPFDLAMDGGAELPKGFGEFRKGAVLDGWFEEAGVNYLFGTLKSLFEINVDVLCFALFPKAGSYELRLRLETPSPTAAKTLVQILNIGKKLKPIGGVLGEVLFANLPEQDGRFVNLYADKLSAEQINALVKIF